MMFPDFSVVHEPLVAARGALANVEVRLVHEEAV